MSKLYSLSWITLIIVLYGISLLACLIREIYDFNHRGKFVLKINKRNSMLIFWIVIIVICCLFLFNDIRSLNKYEELLRLSNNARVDVQEIRSTIEASYNYSSNDAKNDAIFQFGGICISIMFMISAIRYSDIRENGIYLNNIFLKWSKIKSYNWICTNTMTNSTAIEFEIDTFFNKNKKINLDLEITEEQKTEINEVLKRYSN